MVTSYLVRVICRLSVVSRPLSVVIRHSGFWLRILAPGHSLVILVWDLVIDRSLTPDWVRDLTGFSRNRRDILHDPVDNLPGSRVLLTGVAATVSPATPASELQTTGLDGRNRGGKADWPCRMTRHWSRPRRWYILLAVERRACATAAAQRQYVRSWEAAGA